MLWQKWIRFTLTVLLFSAGAATARGFEDVACARFFANPPVSQDALEFARVATDFLSPDFVHLGMPFAAYHSVGTSLRENISFGPLTSQDRGSLLFGNMSRISVEPPPGPSRIHVSMGRIAAGEAVWSILLDSQVFISIGAAARLNPELLSPTASTLPFNGHGPLADDFAFATGPERLMRARTSLTVSQRILGGDVAFNRSVTFVRNPETGAIVSIEFRETQLHGTNASPSLVGTATSGWTHRFTVRTETWQ